MRKETDLYAPLKAFLETQGFAVRGEVNQCDLVAVRADELVVIELKTAFNLELVFQGVERQKLADTVYVAVEAPRSARGRWKDVVHLCRRLGLGLLTVSFTRREPGVEVICEPEPYAPRRNLRKRTALLKEFHARSADHNAGGSTRRPLVTAYREDALRVAVYLEQHGPTAPKNARAVTGITRAAAILQQNVYGWFERVEKGIYEITPRGREAINTYADVVAQL